MVGLGFCDRLTVQQLIIPPCTAILCANLLSLLSDNKTVVIICAVLGSVACIALIGFIIWCVRKKKCCSETEGEFWKRTLIQFLFEGVSVAVFPINDSLVTPHEFYFSSDAMN